MSIFKYRHVARSKSEEKKEEEVKTEKKEEEKKTEEKMDTDDGKKEEGKQEGEKKEGESSSTASGVAPSSSLVMGEELNKMVKNIMGSDNHVPEYSFQLSNLDKKSCLIQALLKN